MKSFYRVKSTYYICQLQTEFEYCWFVYQRTPNYKSQTERTIGPKSAAQALAKQISQELFTFQEACQLQVLLKTFLGELAVI